MNSFQKLEFASHVTITKLQQVMENNVSLKYVKVVIRLREMDNALNVMMVPYLQTNREIVFSLSVDTMNTLNQTENVSNVKISPCQLQTRCSVIIHVQKLK